MAYENPTDQLNPQSSAVPSTASSTAASPNPVLSSLAAATQRANEMVQQATTQVKNTPMYSGGTSAQPQMPVKNPGLFGDSSVHNLDNQHPTTRAGARNKAVGQVAAQAGGFIRQWTQKKQAEKTQALAQDINRSLELQKGIDESTQVLQSDPNNAQAKAILQKNQSLLGSLLSGKNGKDIAKAYDVTFGEGAKQSAQDMNDKDKQHKAAMTDAMKQHQQDERLQQFEGQQPGRMQANPQYEAAQKNLAAVQKQADALTKTYVTMAGHVMGQENTQATAVSREKVAQIGADSRTAIENNKEASASKLEQQKHSEKMQEIQLQGSNRLAAVKAAKQAGENDKGMKMAEDFAKATDGNIGKQQQEIDNLTKELNKPEMKQADNESARKLIAQQITQHQTTIKALQQQKDQAIMEMHSDPDAGAMYQLIGNMDNQ